jgi:hypothetical protein
MGAGAYVIIRGSERSAFQTASEAYEELAVFQLETRLGYVTDTLFQLAEAYPDTVSLSAWPNVTLPDYPLAAQYGVNATALRHITYSPLVSRAQETAWEAYATANVDLLAGNQTEYTGGSWPVRNGIYRYDDEGDRVEDSDSALLCPAWQIAPVHGLEEYVMFNQYSDPALSPLFDALITGSVTSATSNATVVSNGEDDSIGVVSTVGVYADGSLVGFMSANFTLESLLENSLPSDARGVYVVFQYDDASAAPFATVYLNGPSATFLQAGDGHETAYNWLRYTQIIQINVGNNLYVEVYPSKSLQDSYYTTLPRDGTIVLVLAILATAVVFVAYDIFVLQREQYVRGVADANTSIVKGLFPK